MDLEMTDYKYLKLRGGVWWFRRRVPKGYQMVLGKKVLEVSLGTSEAHTALHRRDQLSAQFDKYKTNTESERFNEVLTWLSRTGVSAEKVLEQHQDEIDMDRHLGYDPAKTSEGYLEYSAAQVALGRSKEIPEQFSYSWSQALQDYQETKNFGDLKNTTKLNYRAAVREWQEYTEVPQVHLVTTPMVLAWLDSLSHERGMGSVRRRTLCNCLGKIWKWAGDRGKFSKRTDNPFYTVDHKEAGNSESRAYDEMPDTLFEQVVMGLEPVDRLPALMCRFMGMRLNEPWTMEYENVEGIDCLRGGSKTKDGIRIIPVPDSIRDQVMAWVRKERPLSLSDVAKRPHDAWGKKFNKACKILVPDEASKISSHSCRVAFITNVYNRMKSVGGDLDTETKLGWVVGHSNNKQRSQSREYHRGYPIETLVEVVEAGSYWSGSTSVFAASFG
jgi:integrase